MNVSEGVDLFGQLLGEPEVELEQGKKMRWTFGRWGPLEASPRQQPGLGELRQRIGIARLATDALGTARGTARRSASADIDPHRAMSAYRLQLEAQWDAGFTATLDAVAAKRLDGLQSSANSRNTAELLTEARNLWLAENGRPPSPEAVAAADGATPAELAWAERRVDALLGGPPLTTRAEWMAWNVAADLAGRAVTALTRAAVIRRKGGSPKLSAHAADLNTRAALKHRDTAEQGELDNRDEHADAYMLAYHRRELAERTASRTPSIDAARAGLRGPKPRSTMLVDASSTNRATLQNRVATTTRGMVDVTAMKALNKAHPGLAWGRPFADAIAEAAAITRRLAERRERSGPDLRQEPGL